MPTIAAGSAAAISAAAFSVRHGAAVAGCEKHGQGAMGVLSKAILAGDWGVRIFHLAQGVKFLAAILANIFVNWHSTPPVVRKITSQILPQCGTLAAYRKVYTAMPNAMATLSDRL